MSHPYRAPAALPVRFICTVCFQRGSRLAGGPCECGGQMLPLDNAEVVALMRAHAEKRRQRRMRPLLVLAVAGSIAMWLGVCVAFGIRIEPAPATTKFGGASWLIGFVFASTGAVYFGYPSVPPDVSRLVEQLRVRVVD